MIMLMLFINYKRKLIYDRLKDNKEEIKEDSNEIDNSDNSN